MIAQAELLTKTLTSLRGATVAAHLGHLFVEIQARLLLLVDALKERRPKPARRGADPSSVDEVIAGDRRLQLAVNLIEAAADMRVQMTPSVLLAAAVVAGFEKPSGPAGADSLRERWKKLSLRAEDLVRKQRALAEQREEARAHNAALSAALRRHMEAGNAAGSDRADPFPDPARGERIGAIHKP